MSQTVYDENLQRYVEFVDRVFASEPNLFGEMLATFRELLGDNIANSRICDIACGEGYVSRHLAQFGAAEVVGIDISAALVDVARQRSAATSLSFHVDDAQELGSLEDASFDIAVCQMALMDIPDHRATFRAIHRVLKSGGLFAFSLLHPCFEAPFEPPAKPHFLFDGDGVPTTCLVHRYATEGHWRSEGAGLRGHVGSYHRTLSTYINDVVGCGFRIQRLVEPVFGVPGIASEVPRVLLGLARAD